MYPRPRCARERLNGAVLLWSARALTIQTTGPRHTASVLITLLVARGASYVSPSLASTLISGLGGAGGRPRHEVLSTREYQVLCLFGSGISFKQIAAELGVSPKTVSTYRSRICDKLKLSSNAAIIRYAIEHHLVPSAPSTLPRRRKSPTDKSAD